MKYNEVVEGYEHSPSGYVGEIKYFIKENKYAVGGVTLAVVIGVIYYVYSKKTRQ